MKLIKQKLIKEINAILKTTFAATDLGDPPKIEMGEFTLPCFELAKIEKKNPAQIALEFAVKLIDHKIPWLENVQAVGPYLNFFIKPAVWAKAVLFDLIKEKKLKLKKSQKVMIEFASLNTHKQTHVGHLRNVVLGEALVKFYRYLGFDVVASCYIGDIGTHVAKCLWNYMKNHAADQLPTNKGKYLGEIYIEASNLIAENEVLKTEVSEVLQRLEAREKFITKVWQETREWSLEELRGIYDEMNTKFDVWFFESEEEAKADRVINKLVKDKNIPEIRKSEGAIIADLEKYDLGVLVLIKADGTKAYGAKDIALAIKKFKKFKLDKSIMVVDNRQSLYFKQIFKILELTGHDIKKMKHVPYDFVTTPQGAMASRKGNVIPYEDFRDLMLDKLIEKTKERHPDWPAAKLDDAAAAVALSAMKFGMLKYENNSVVVFDMDAAISTEGATGPYLLYTVARFNSILRKVTPAETTGKLDLSLLNSIEEKDLLKHLSKFEDAIEGCAKLYDPSGMCTYLLELSQKLNTFYHKHQILKADKDVKHARLVLVNVALAVMKRGLKLLNIETVEEM